MKVAEVAKLSPLDRFLYWIRERHAIYIRRKAGEARPWTDDEVLQRYFFTNPYRENDKVTVWFRENIREPLHNDSRVVFATVAFRWFNLPSTGQVLKTAGLLNRWDTATAVKALSKIRDEGNKVFTGAFNISNSGSTKPKINRVCEDYIQPVWEDRQSLLRDLRKPGMTMEAAHARLMEYPGLCGSGFMAYEVVCDLRYTYILENASDKLTWSNPGPGARRGLNRLMNRPIDGPCKDYQAESVKLLATVSKRLAKLPPLEMREIEHSLCEFDKHERARLGDGHMKRRYAGT